MARIAFVMIGLSACGAPELELPRTAPEAPLAVSVRPEAPLDGVPEVLRIDVDGASERTRTGRFLLFSGELTDYHLGRIRKRDYPKTLLEREIPTQTWVDGSLRIVIAPERVLEPGGIYSLASEASGLIGVLRVRDEPGPLFERLWPGLGVDGDISGGGLFVYCLAQPRAPAAVVEPARAALGPLELAVRVSPGVDASGAWSDRCVHVVPESPAPDGSILVMPPELYGALVDPAPIRVAVEPALSPLSCQPGEMPFGPGCATVHDDRLIVRPPASPALWVLDVGGAALVRVSEAELSFVVRGLVPETRQVVRGAVYDANGSGIDVNVEVETGAPERHLVLNEVLANPVGPEPGQEWVEIVNDGPLAILLSGITFEDVGGSTLLPDVELGPGEHALLVGEDFDPASGFDLAPAAGVALLRLSMLGKNGLANGGEPLRLRDETGAVISSFPALSSPAAGVSLARSAPDALDADPSSFGLHGGDGASPGEPNLLAR